LDLIITRLRLSYFVSKANMAIDRKPTVLLVHGSWHRPCHYERLIRQLKQLGFEVVCPALPSIGKDRLGKGWHDDVLRIQETALQLFAKKKQVVLLAHSYGGIPAAAATEGLTRSERAAAGLPGGFCHVIYMSAFALPAREMSLLQSVGGSFPSWVNHGETYGQSKDRSTYLNTAALEVLYNDLPDEEVAWAQKMLVPQSQLAAEQGASFVAADVVVPQTFIVCEQDLAMPVAVQEMLIAAIPGMMSARIDASHSPFLSKPAELANIVGGIMERS